MKFMLSVTAQWTTTSTLEPQLTNSLLFRPTTEIAILMLSKISPESIAEVQTKEKSNTMKILLSKERKKAASCFERSATLKILGIRSEKPNSKQKDSSKDTLWIKNDNVFHISVVTYPSGDQLFQPRGWQKISQRLRKSLLNCPTKCFPYWIHIYIWVLSFFI